MRTLIIIIILLLYFIYSIPALLITYLYGKLKKDERVASKLAQKQIACIFKIICFFGGIKRNISGLENIPKNIPVLYVANHRGYFDIVVSYSCIPEPTSFVSKKELQKVPIVKHWMILMKCLFLDRENIKEGMKTILTGINQIKNGYSIFIMPEGTRNHSDKLLPFHEGSFKFAQKTRCPIIPVSLLNTDNAFENHFPWIRKTNISIHFGKPIYINQLPSEHKKFPGAYCQKIIQETLENLKTDMIK